jgi:hypothetical protein
MFRMFSARLEILKILTIVRPFLNRALEDRPRVAAGF